MNNLYEHIITNRKVKCIKDTRHNGNYHNCYNGTVRVGEILNIHIINGTECLFYNDDLNEWITNLDAPCGKENFLELKEDECQN